MSKNLFVNYYPNNKEKLQKGHVKDIKIFLEKKKKKKQHCGQEHYKVSQKMKNKSLLSMEQIL